MTGHLIQTIRMILYQADVVNGQTEHHLSILAAPERVLFVYRQLEIQWEIRFFAIPAPTDRNFSRATAHTIDYWFFDKEKSLVGGV